MAKARITENDLLGKLREANVLDFSQVDAAVAETTGDISVLHRERGDTPLSDNLLDGVIDAHRYQPRPVQGLILAALSRETRLDWPKITEETRHGCLYANSGDAAGRRPDTHPEPSERLNAWTPVIQAELETAIRAAGDNPDVRCIIITGAGPRLLRRGRHEPPPGHPG